MPNNPEWQRPSQRISRRKLLAVGGSALALTALWGTAYIVNRLLAEDQIDRSAETQFSTKFDTLFEAGLNLKGEKSDTAAEILFDDQIKAVNLIRTTDKSVRAVIVTDANYTPRNYILKEPDPIEAFIDQSSESSGVSERSPIEITSESIRALFQEIQNTFDRAKTHGTIEIVTKAPTDI